MPSMFVRDRDLPFISWGWDNPARQPHATETRVSVYKLIFCPDKGRLGTYKWTRSHPSPHVPHTQPTAPSLSGGGFPRVSLLATLLGRHHYSRFEERETEAQSLLQMKGRLCARCLIMRRDSS